MKTGRNDPCPCGSGRKHKHCCAERNARAGSAMRLLDGRGSKMKDAFAEVSAALPAGTPWDAGVIPLAGGIESDPTARLAVVLIVANGLVLHGDVVSHPPAEIDGIAAMMASAVHDVIARGAARPPAIRVRHDGIAVALAPLLASLGVAVSHVRKLSMLDEVSSSLIQAMGGFDEPMPAVSMPHTWSAWGLPNTMIAELFAAAAVFHDAQPWAHLTDDQLLQLDLATGSGWAASVLGNAGEEFGLALYEDPEDLFLIFASSGPSEAFSAMQSAVLSLTFSSRSDLPKPMQREVARSGWTIAGARAYPLLWTLNTPGGGITAVQMSELTNSLYAVARFATANKGRLADPTGDTLKFDWSDANSGTVVHHRGSREPENPSLWQLPKSLTLALPQGPNANGRAIGHGEEIEVMEQRLVTRFEEWLRESGSSETRVSADLENARLFVHAMTQYQDIPLAAVTEYDLRVFMYDWFPRKVMRGKTAAMRMRGSLRRFFDFLATRGGIVYPWASAILRDKAGFEDRWDSFPGGFFWDKQVREWQGHLYADLDERAMMPANALADVGDWGDTMGPNEAQMYSLLQREWLSWRDEVISGGITERHAVRAELVLRQHEWERRGRADFGGRSVSQVVGIERSKKPGKASPE